MDFTYEFKNTKLPLEQYEWDNTWVENANDAEKPRVLYIGDSISCGTRGIINRLADKDLFCDGFGTSKAVDNPFFAESVKLFAKQLGRYDLVIFNNGLHGWHLADRTEYAEYYEKLLCEFLEFFKKIPFAIVLTTDVLGDADRSERVAVRNKIAGSIAEKYSIPVIDLYKKSLEIAELHRDDGVHFTPEGNEILADFLLCEMKKLIK
ncbi:MAG: SGNH/GDSL hydrolase family protein [Clostridia bacterium]|nr:SGNH/GDSL hydrolase family protein [Clostridia bacterium]